MSLPKCNKHSLTSRQSRPLAGYGFTPDLRFDRHEIDTVNRHDAGTCNNMYVQVFRTYCSADLCFYVGHCHLDEMILTDRGSLSFVTYEISLKLCYLLHVKSYSVRQSFFLSSTFPTCNWPYMAANRHSLFTDASLK